MYTNLKKKKKKNTTISAPHQQATGAGSARMAGPPSVPMRQTYMRAQLGSRKSCPRRQRDRTDLWECMHAHMGGVKSFHFIFLLFLMKERTELLVLKENM